MNRVSLWDVHVREEFWELTGKFSLVLSLLLVVVDIPSAYKSWPLLVGLLTFLMLIYVVTWWQAQRVVHVDMRINDTAVCVRVGDIFDQPGLKVIAFNEFFDTIVDNQLVAERSLNATFLRQHVADIAHLDHAIAHDAHLAVRRTRQVSRPHGNTQAYELGSICEYDGFLLTAFSRFDGEQRAFLSTKDYITCMLNFWQEVERVYAGRAVVVPLMGAGITRFIGYSTISAQELLELMLYTLKLSRVSLRPGTTMTFVVRASTRSRINFYKLRNLL